ncbi:hypothetical protein QJS66_12555 [Kocuria rhizophila]|nr:hypothetical protein QJS66_12555 [Kocuria rhizophila]
MSGSPGATGKPAHPKLSEPQTGCDADEAGALGPRPPSPLPTSRHRRSPLDQRTPSKPAPTKPAPTEPAPARPTTPAPSPGQPVHGGDHQLTTLQFQQRTQDLLATQLKLTPAEQLGPLTPRNVELQGAYLSSPPSATWPRWTRRTRSSWDHPAGGRRRLPPSPQT